LEIKFEAKIIEPSITKTIPKVLQTKNFGDQIKEILSLEFGQANISESIKMLKSLKL